MNAADMNSWFAAQVQTTAARRVHGEAMRAKAHWENERMSVPECAAAGIAAAELQIITEIWPRDIDHNIPTRMRKLLQLREAAKQRLLGYRRFW